LWGVFFVVVNYLNKNIKDTLDLARNNMINESNIDCVLILSNNLIESTQDFTDSLYINNEERDKILKLQNAVRDQVNLFLTKTNDEKQLTDNQIQYTRLFKATPILNSCEMLKQIVRKNIGLTFYCPFLPRPIREVLNSGILSVRLCAA
jgi:hypothetical protein